jgi:hypothetical protein
LYVLPCKGKSDQLEDGQNMSLREAMEEHHSNKNIKQVVF